MTLVGWEGESNSDHSRHGAMVTFEMVENMVVGGTHRSRGYSGCLEIVDVFTHRESGRT